MKSYFGFSLKGRDWWKPFFLFWIVYIALYIPFYRLDKWGLSLVENVGLFLVAELVFMTAIIILTSIFSIVCCRIILPTLSIGGASFSFKGSIGKYIGMMLLGTLLTIVTLTVYFPWFSRRVYGYILSETTFKDAHPQFMGKGGKMLAYYLLAFLLPLVLAIAVFTLLVGVDAYFPGAPLYALYSGIVGFIVFIFLIPFLYLVYKWMVNIRWNDVTIRWQTTFWPSCLFILGQLLLTVITVSIYWPAAALRIYRYFAQKTVLEKPDGETGRLGFDGSIRGGFGLLWGQFLLTIVTLGFYAPWACTRVGRWLFGATYFETKNPA